MMKFIYAYSGIDILSIFNYPNKETLESIVDEYGFSKTADKTGLEKVIAAAVQFGSQRILEKAEAFQ